MEIFHVTESELDGFRRAERQVVRSVVRHLLSGCERCSQKVRSAINFDLDESQHIEASLGRRGNRSVHAQNR